MRTETQLQAITGAGWWRGFGPLLRREQRRWWGGKRWWVQALFWTLLLNGLLVLTLFVMPQAAATDGVTITPAEAFEFGVQIFFGLGVIAPAIGAIILLQDVVIEEKSTGIAEWLLSKPLARSAYVLAKLLPNMLGMAVTMLLIPGAVGYAIFWIFDAEALNLTAFLASGGIVALHLLFYLTLSLMLGVILRTRRPLLGITLGSLLGGSLVPVTAVVQFTPWKLGELSVLPMLGSALPPIATTMLVSTALWSLLFVGVAIWQMQRLEV
jgi:ABC-2 type transport system permease protein